MSTGPDHEPARPSHAPTKRSPIVGIDDPDDLAPPPEAPAAEHLDDLLPKQPSERSVSRRVGFAIAGAVLILIGLVIWITPVIGGSPFFIIPGLLLLSRASEPVRRAVNFGDRQLPHRVRGFMRWARDRVTRSKKRPPAQSPESDDTSSSPSPRDGL